MEVGPLGAFTGHVQEHVAQARRQGSDLVQAPHPQSVEILVLGTVGQFDPATHKAVTNVSEER